MTRRFNTVAILLILAAGAQIAAAAISLSTTTAATQTFDGIGATATASLPADFAVDKTATATANDIRKVGTFAAAVTATERAGGANLGTTASNGIYNFGAGTTTTGTDRAIGFLASGTATASGNLYAHLTNHTGGTLSGLQISYNVEQYRDGSNANGFRIQMYYSADGATWTSAGPNFLTAFAKNADNNGFATAPGATIPVSGQMLSVTIPDSTDFYLAWNYSVTAGTTVTNAQALAIDDISILGTNAPTSPTGTGLATPSSVTVGSNVVLSAVVAPGTNPASTGLAVSCDLTGIGGSSTFVLAPQTATTFSSMYSVPAGTATTGYSLPCTITDDQARSGAFNIALTVTPPFACGSAVTAIHTIQGTGAASLLAGSMVDVEGIVVGNFQGTSKLRGFYLQEPDATWDNDPTTSEGIFIFDNNIGIAVNVGDRVRVRGTVSEFTTSGSFLGNTQNSSLTEIGALTAELQCSTGNSFTVTTVTLPVANYTDWERYEGMAVQFSQALTVTGNFSLGTQGWIDLAPALQYGPTDVPGNATSWGAAASLVSRSVIALDDASTLTNANLYPTLYPTGGLSDANTLRSGDLVNSPLTGILDDRFGEYRIQPASAVAFSTGNPRPAVGPLLSSVSSRFRAVSANVLNFFTTLGSRGAQTVAEFEHQKEKVIAELSAMDADVYGLSEVQNFDDGNTGSAKNSYTNAALQSLVDGLNCVKAGQDALCDAPPAGPFALIDTLNLGSNNGTDAIRTAMIYRPDRLTPEGGPAMYYQNDTNRPTLAQTFQPASGNKAAQQTFTFVVNHFRSKGSACGGASDDPFEGNCNGLRLNMAQNVVTWLAGNPTSDPAGANRRLLLVGDFNAYYGEDPIQWFGTHGYTNLIHAIIGANAYSYNFGSQAGYLDHSFANSPMNSLVKKVAEWHNNADEPSALEALDSANKSVAAQVAYYGADPWAASDHDPFVVGFNTLPGDLNDDGVVDTNDGKLLQAAVGRSASAVDRRMDYDGDGTITLNDYRAWANYYKAYLQ